MYINAEQMAGIPFFDKIIASLKESRELKAKQEAEKRKAELIKIAIPAGAVVLMAFIMMKKRDTKNAIRK